MPSDEDRECFQCLNMMEDECHVFIFVLCIMLSDVVSLTNATLLKLYQLVRYTENTSLYVYRKYFMSSYHQNLQ